MYVEEKSHMSEQARSSNKDTSRSVRIPQLQWLAGTVASSRDENACTKKKRI